MPVSEEKEQNTYKRCHKWGFVILVLLAIILTIFVAQQISKPRKIIPIDFAKVGLDISEISPDLLLTGFTIH